MDILVEEVYREYTDLVNKGFEKILRRLKESEISEHGWFVDNGFDTITLTRNPEETSLTGEITITSGRFDNDYTLQARLIDLEGRKVCGKSFENLSVLQTLRYVRRYLFGTMKLHLQGVGNSKIFKKYRV